MAASDYTDIFARFTDQLAAKTLADFIAAAGIPCDLVEVWDSQVFGRQYAIRVARALIADLKDTLKLTQVADYKDLISADVLAGRLAREGIPCYVGGLPVIHTLALGYSGVPIDDTGQLRLGTVAVPASLVPAAQRILRDSVSETELTELALRTAPDPEDPP